MSTILILIHCLKNKKSFAEVHAPLRMGTATRWTELAHIAQPDADLRATVFWSHEIWAVEVFISLEMLLIYQVSKFLQYIINISLEPQEWHNLPQYRQFVV